MNDDGKVVDPNVRLLTAGEREEIAQHWQQSADKSPRYQNGREVAPPRPMTAEQLQVICDHFWRQMPAPSSVDPFSLRVVAKHQKNRSVRPVLVARMERLGHLEGKRQRERAKAEQAAIDHYRAWETRMAHLLAGKDARERVKRYKQSDAFSRAPTRQKRRITPLLKSGKLNLQ
ncbi:MAG TPA: hypothetical protein VFB37_07605 [Steroidobacteraceae bacterium]|nr:hypothetical protein [Steroidobacteraceae bacterium]